MTDTPKNIDPADLPFEPELKWQEFKDEAPPPPPTSATDKAQAPKSAPPLTSTRAVARQATSYMAFRGEEPGADDPLLDFEPVPHKAPRRNSIGPDRQRAFIAHLAATGIVVEAARQIGASTEALYKLRRWPGAEGFSSAWDAALDRGIDRLEEGALARAIKGSERLVVSGGKVLGTEQRHNEALVMFMLRARRPERYAAAIQPGHPIYERIRAEVLAGIANDGRDEEEILASIDAKLARFRERHDAANNLLLEQRID